MNLKQILLTSSLLIFPLCSNAQKYPLTRKGVPTTSGIEKYVPDKAWSVQKEFQELVSDTIYDIYFDTENLGGYSENEEVEELGFYESGGAIINNQEKYKSYELDDLSFEERKRIISSNKFVRGTMAHELAHGYVNQIILELSINEIKADRSYRKNISFYPDENFFGASFIEEGIAEYISEEMDEIILPWKPFIPKKESELLNEKKMYEVKYQYSPYFLKKFMKSHGIKKGIQTLVTNPPPTNEEILNPRLFFERLKIYGGPRSPYPEMID